LRRGAQWEGTATENAACRYSSTHRKEDEAGRAGEFDATGRRGECISGAFVLRRDDPLYVRKDYRGFFDKLQTQLTAFGPPDVGPHGRQAEFGKFVSQGKDDDLAFRRCLGFLGRKQFKPGPAQSNVDEMRLEADFSVVHEAFEVEAVCPYDQPDVSPAVIVFSVRHGGDLRAMLDLWLGDQRRNLETGFRR
jgi:hypothetical protein